MVKTLFGLMTLVSLFSFANHSNNKDTNKLDFLTRKFDASDNTVGGEPGDPLLRLTPNDYGDGRSTPSGANRPNPREISNIVSPQGNAEVPNMMGASDWVWQWGQFLDHDLDLTGGAVPAEPFDISVARNDPFFGQLGVIRLNRSIFKNIGGVREQLNEITAFIDGSQVYGSDEETANSLRTLDGTGRLRTSKGGLLPVDEAGSFIAGDVRVNEQVGLTAIHTVFVREHNYWARRLGFSIPTLRKEVAAELKKIGSRKLSKAKLKELWERIKKRRGDYIFNLARSIVIIELQQISYNEFLPVIVGDARPDVGEFPSPAIANEFSTAAFRFGHSMLSPTLMMADGKGNLPLKDAFFKPEVVKERGIEPILRGLARQHAQEVDTLLVDGVRNFLFGDPTQRQEAFDLASLNIQRGRDHGLPSYNAVRFADDGTFAEDYSDISENPVVALSLMTAYGPGNVDQVDLWVGGLAEDPAEGALVGPLFQQIIAGQFERTRLADKFWYDKVIDRLPVSKKVRKEISNTLLSDILERTTRIRKNELQDDVFMVKARDIKPQPKWRKRWKYRDYDFEFDEDFFRDL